MDVQGVHKTKSVWMWEQWRPASRRSTSWLLQDTWEVRNITTDEGVTHALDVVFSGGLAKPVWYIALFNNDYTPIESNTYQSPGYTESTNYDEGARPTWQEAGVASKSLTNASNRAEFTMKTTENIYGGSLVSANTKGDAVSGEILYCVSKFSAPKPVEDNDVLKVTVVISGDDA